MKQTPEPGGYFLKWRGDTLEVTLRLDRPRPGRAALRTNLGRASVRRGEIIAETERGDTPMARAWTDLPLEEKAPGVFTGTFALDEVGIFSAKACFFPEGSHVPEWPDGDNFHVKVASEYTRRGNSIYTVFPRQFGSFREVARRLDFIMGELGFNIIQTLPPFPVPVTYAVMGEYGCPFAALDFLSVDPAMAEFDEYATPLDQFHELIDAVHARQGLFFVDLPANHTGWASTLQTHHPDWFHREADGHFVSPGAWGVKWADLVELDYSNAQLRAYMADVFLFWCRQGVDGFRCDAGYMIPHATWEYIVSRVREEYPDTVFMLEGLGGKLEVTDRLLAVAGLDWAYSELFQTYDRNQFEWYLPQAIARSEKYGTLVHFAETHDNDRLAKGGEAYARLRVALAALLSWQGAWGIANGVEWLCTEKIDVHGKNDLNWGAKRNLVAWIARLNRLLVEEPGFAGAAHLEVITRGDGNTLAVKRGNLLVVANLDCQAAASCGFDAASYPATTAVDLLTGEELRLSGGQVPLPPGGIRCLRAPALAESAVGVAATPPVSAPQIAFHWQFPRDTQRILTVPEGQRVKLSAQCHFRMELVDAVTGRTIRSGRSDERHCLVFTAPHYRGDGTRCRRLRLKGVGFLPEKPVRLELDFLVPPTADRAKVRLRMEADELRRHADYRAILSNGSGAAAQVRAGWGTIASQYDAFLAANPKRVVPSDRLNLWTRTRCWIQREGYSREVDARSQTCFTADPSGRGARWSFRVPCGMGRSASFDFTLSLSHGVNAARLTVLRHEVADAEDIGDQVRLVFRPQLEWRSFHSTTKAYSGPEARFAAAVRPLSDGFVFEPYDGRLRARITNGEYHHEPQWEYSVAHPEEAERGQDGCGDLFSPGWISADLRPGDSMTLTLQLEDSHDRGELQFLIEQFPAVSYIDFDEALHQALELFIVRRDDLKTVIAGYPWFLDWGRDTFIFLRGLMAAGRMADSVRILRAFAAFEEKGTLPNIIYGKTAGNRDTTDAPLWFIRCVQEVEEAGGFTSKTIASELRKTCASIVDNYLKGTPNGIRVDRESMLVWSPSHFTWMDTNYPACTPRVGYPVEIEALWISALSYLGREAEAAQALASVKRLFRREQGGYADCLAAPRGESAAQARAEDTLRPNQLFLITLGILDDRSILEATSELLVPGGIRSLGSEHSLYRGRYTGDEDSSRKWAYHNGTVWLWQFPLYAEALAMTGLASPDVARSLLASAVENLNTGCLGQMSEIADGDSPHAQKGCCAQAWSASELLRVWLKLKG